MRVFALSTKERKKSAHTQRSTGTHIPICGAVSRSPQFPWGLRCLVSQRCSEHTILHKGNPRLSHAVFPRGERVSRLLLAPCCLNESPRARCVYRNGRYLVLLSLFYPDCSRRTLLSPRCSHVVKRRDVQGTYRLYVLRARQMIISVLLFVINNYLLPNL